MLLQIHTTDKTNDMKTALSFLSTVLLVSLLIFSCSKKSEDQVAQPPGGGGNTGGGSATCDTANMTYSANIKAILQSNCYSCHGNGQANGGVTLDTYAGVKTVADNGKLIGVITHAAGFPAMPQGGTKLSDCNINKIKDWINRGTQNN